MGDLDLGDAATIIELMRRAPSPRAIAQLRVFGGAMARVSPEATAFSQRDASTLVAAMGLFEADADPTPHDAWTGEFLAAFADKATGVYVNFLGSEGEDRIRSAYPHGAFEKLAAIKRRYDPDNLFRLNQNVRPA
jgi:FAD/FMN-containing dehydrogenase